MTDQNKETEVAALEIMPPSALEALERAHIDVQIATAHRYPRSLELFQKRALAMATLDEETAESCIYSRPVGKQKNEKTGAWEMKFAEGNSVRLAEIVCASYGNIRVACRIVEQTERYVKCEGIAHDLETNYAAKSEVMESTVTSEGKPYSERMRLVVAKACLSKARRDAVFQVVPKALCKRVSDEAKKIAVGDASTLENRRKRIAEWLKSINIDDARLFATLNVNGWSDIGIEHVETLTGLKTSLKDGDVTKDEAFPPVVKKGTIGQDAKEEANLAGAGLAPEQSPMTDEQVLAELQRRMGVDGVTEGQVLGYCRLKEVKLATEKQVELLQLAPAKHRLLLQTWSSVLPNIRKVVV